MLKNILITGLTFMTSGMMNNIKKYKQSSLLIFIFCFSVPSYAIELSDLLKLFVQQKESTVDFDEIKEAFYLEKPIKSSGRLEFSYPNKLSKYILEPEKLSQKINGNELTIQNGDKTHTINLDERPEFSVILRSLISLLSGNHDALKKDFKIKFNSSSDSWNLLLSPRDSYILSYVQSIKLIGNKTKLSKIIITEPNNDRSVSSLYNHR